MRALITATYGYIKITEGRYRRTGFGLAMVGLIAISTGRPTTMKRL